MRRVVLAPQYGLRAARSKRPRNNAHCTFSSVFLVKQVIQINIQILTKNIDTMPDKYSIILPTYNERKNLPILVYLLDMTFKQAQLDWEVIIVDDNSPDGTQEVAKKLIDVFSPNTSSYALVRAN